MQKSENEEVEYAHNLAGAPPADFSDVENPMLRAKNRGAVLANIFEKYVTETPKGTFLAADDFAMCTREMDAYFERMPDEEKVWARRQMMVHLERRGYKSNGA